MKLRSLLIVCTLALATLVIGCKEESPAPAAPAAPAGVLEEAGKAADEAVDEAKESAEKAMCAGCNMPKEQCKCAK